MIDVQRAKARLVRFLHEEKGFDVLAFECGLFDCHRARQAMRAGQGARSALDGVLFPLYVDRQQLPSTASLNDLWRLTRHVAAGTDTSGQEALPTSKARQQIDQTLDRMAELLVCPGRTTSPSSNSQDPDFWRQALVNLRGAIELTWTLGLWNPSENMDAAIHNTRDTQMAENLLWLKRHRYPGRKIIVWSLTLHLARDQGKLEAGERETQKRFSRFDLLGARLAAALEPDPFVVAYTAFEGRKGSIFQQPHALLVPTQGSLEDLLGRTELEIAFLDLHRLSTADGGSWLARPLIARPIAFKELRGVWSQHLDALFFIRTFEATRRVPN